MFDEKNKKCVNPWLGLLVIALACLVIGSAVFFGSKHSRRRQNRVKTGAGKGASKVNFEYPGTGVSGYPDNRLIF